MPPGSIPSVEKFRELVAWLGTQSSLHREDEGPTTQVPQHMEDESYEATISEPFTIEEEADDTQTTQVAAATPERSLEAISEPPTPAVDPSSPRNRPFHSSSRDARGPDYTSPNYGDFSSSYSSTAFDR